MGAAARTRLPGGAAARLQAEIRAGLRIAVLLGMVGGAGAFLFVVSKLAIIGLVLPTGSMPTLLGMLIGVAVLAVTLVALSHLRDLALIHLSHRVARRLAAPALMAAANRRGHDPARAGTEVLADVEEVRRGVAGPLCAAALDSVMIPILLALLITMHWGFALYALVAAALAFVLGYMAHRSTTAILAEANGTALRGTLLVSDSVRCAEAVMAMGMLPALVRRWAGTLARGAGQLRDVQRVAWAASATMTTLWKAASTGALVLGSILVMQGADIGMGIIIAMIATGHLMNPFSRVAAMLDEAASARAAWGRLDALLREADAEKPAELRSWPCPEGRLSVERITFLHPGATRPLLRDISFAMGPGEVVALAGPPGSGKSTLLRLILGIERPVAGAVFLDGHATAHWDRTDFARHVGYLPQDPALQGGTVAEAIARLSPEPDMAAVLRAIRLVGGERLIADLPHGFSTPLDRQVQLSMGQRQRIALARAIYGSPRLVVLDEPAAYLDAEGEEAVLRLLSTLAEAGSAVLFTSHREGLLRAAQRTLHLQMPAEAIAGPRPMRRIPPPGGPALTRQGAA